MTKVTPRNHDGSRATPPPANRTEGNVTARAKGLRAFEALVDRGADAAAEVHKQILAMPYEVIKQFPSLAAQARKVHEVQDAVIDAIYGSVRKANKAIADAAASLLESVEGQRSKA